MDDPTPDHIMHGLWVRFSSPVIDESHAAWGGINDDSYLLGIEFSHEYYERFSYPDKGFYRVHHTTPLLPCRHMFITQFQASTSKGISLFVANAFENLRDELGEDKMSQICKFLQSFTSKVAPGASTMALVDVVRHHTDCYYFETIRDEESRLMEFRVKLVHADKNGFNMKLVEYQVGMRDGTCSICLNEFDEDAEVVKTICSHYFHEKCVGYWMIQKDTCPVCRNVIDTE